LGGLAADAAAIGVRSAPATSRQGIIRLI
jgi:hypothetical protein